MDNKKTNLTMPENHGLIESASTSPLGYAIPFVVRNQSGNWTPYLPAGERQANPTETMACVSFSLTNSIETQELFLTGKKVNYSDRWLAKASGTTGAGNYLNTVGSTVEEIGLVLESSWPTPPNYTWEQYYADPTPAERQKLLAEGREWLKSHKLQHGQITTSLNDIMTFIQQAPLWITIPGHAQMAFYSQQEVQNVFDSYIPYEKKTTRSAFVAVYKAVLTMKNMRFVNDNSVIYLVGDKGKIGFTDMPALQKLQAIDSAPIENGSTQGIPTVGLFESGLTFHN